jgi:hypothetical protein
MFVIISCELDWIFLGATQHVALSGFWRTRNDVRITAIWARIRQQISRLRQTPANVASSNLDCKLLDQKLLAHLDILLVCRQQPLALTQVQLTVGDREVGVGARVAVDVPWLKQASEPFERFCRSDRFFWEVGF